MPGERADVNLRALDTDLVQALDAVDVDQRSRLRQAQAHERDQAVPAREHLGVLAEIVEQLCRLLDRGGACVFECSRDHLRASLPSCPSWDTARELCISFQTRSGLAGMSTCLMPNGTSASQTA